MKKRKMEHFFTAQPKADAKDKKHFIYCPEEKRAFFTVNSKENDVFVTAKCGLKLYYRPTVSPSPAYALPESIAACPYGIPLLKSNLQKAIRRGKLVEAVKTTIALLHLERVELLRRLPIIMLEDVKLFDCLPLVVWFMMADKDYTLCHFDHHLLLNVVVTLCVHTEVVPAEQMRAIYAVAPEPCQPVHTQLQDLPHADLLLALHYRRQYGGMAGDLNMIQNWIHALAHSPSIVPIGETLFDLIDAHSVQGSVSILPEAIDFIPFPQIITILQKKYPQYSTGELRDMIWVAESGVNLRHADSLTQSQAVQNSSKWHQVRAYLSTIRTWMLRESSSSNSNNAAGNSNSSSSSSSAAGNDGGSREGKAKGGSIKYDGLVIELDTDDKEEERTEEEAAEVAPLDSR